MSWLIDSFNGIADFFKDVFSSKKNPQANNQNTNDQNNSKNNDQNNSKILGKKADEMKKDLESNKLIPPEKLREYEKELNELGPEYKNVDYIRSITQTQKQIQEKQQKIELWKEKKANAKDEEVMSKKDNIKFCDSMINKFTQDKKSLEKSVDEMKQSTGYKVQCARQAIQNKQKEQQNQTPHQTKDLNYEQLIKNSGIGNLKVESVGTNPNRSIPDVKETTQRYR